jgi:pyruvoyl-dependent arginine decarboxylase (PvlArgDC)
MARKFLTGTMLICALTFGSGAAFGQSASDDAKKAGKAAEQVGKDTAEATEHASKAAAKTAKKTGKVIKKAVTPGTDTALCKDGTVQKGKTKSTACEGHGGQEK